MPFTGSHPAIILPLLKRRIFSVSGLIMGSMVPDFEFFILLEANVVHGHGLLPMFWLNIPTALICITIYHTIVRNQLIQNLPDYFRKKFRPFLHFDWLTYFKSNYGEVLISILVGNLSHLFWDAFTHSDGFITEHVTYLSQSFWDIPLYHILQYAFSFLGAIGILQFVDRMPNYKLRNYTPISDIVRYWCIVFVVTAAIYLMRYDPVDYENFTARVVFTCAGFLAGLIVASLWHTLKRQKKETRPAVQKA